MKLGTRDVSQLRPVLLRSVEIEPLVEVHPDSESSLVDLEEMAQPGTVQSDHRGIRVREDHSVISPRPFPGVESDARNKKRCLVESTDHGKTLSIELLDLLQLGLALRMRPDAGPRAALGGREGNVSHPDRDGGLAHPQLRSDRLQREALRAEDARLLLLFDLAAISHGRV